MWLSYLSEGIVKYSYVLIDMPLIVKENEDIITI